MKKLFCFLVMVFFFFSSIPPGDADMTRQLKRGYTKAQVDALLAAYCLESVFGDATEADDFVLSGTTLSLVGEIPHLDVAETVSGNWDNTANPWADNEVANTLTLDLLLLSPLASAPGTPAAGRIYYADNDIWDPCDIAGTDNYYCIYDGAAYKAIMDEDGAFFISSIELPSLTHFATGDATFNDTATPHVLTSEECKNSIITNAGAGEDSVYTCPPAEFGMNFMVMVIDAFQMDLEPDGTETLWLNGTQMAAGEHIVNAADTKGDVMACWSVESGDGTYEIFCKSDNANFVEATP